MKPKYLFLILFIFIVIIAFIVIALGSRTVIGSGSEKKPTAKMFNLYFPAIQNVSIEIDKDRIPKIEEFSKEVDRDAQNKLLLTEERLQIRLDEFYKYHSHRAADSIKSLKRDKILVTVTDFDNYFYIYADYMTKQIIVLCNSGGDPLYTNTMEDAIMNSLTEPGFLQEYHIVSAKDLVKIYKCPPNADSKLWELYITLLYITNTTAEMEKKYKICINDPKFVQVALSRLREQWESYRHEPPSDIYKEWKEELARKELARKEQEEQIKQSNQSGLTVYSTFEP